MSKAQASLAFKVRTTKRATFLNQVATQVGCSVYVDSAYNIILEGEREKAHKAFEILKAFGYASRRSEINLANRQSMIFLAV